MTQIKFILVIVSCILCTTKACCQRDTIKTLYFFEDDSSFFLECGNIHTASILFFTSDTLNTANEENDYLIAFDCPDRAFFKKGRKYKITMNKDFSYIKGFITVSKQSLDDFLKFRNSYVMTSIEVVSSKK